MTANDYATMGLALITAALIIIGTIAMIVLWVIRVRRKHPTLGRDFVADVKRGEGFTFHQQLKGKHHAPGTNGGAYKLPKNETATPPRLLTLSAALKIINDEPDEVPHTLIVGSTRKGKTTLAHAIIGLRSDKVAILDPKWYPDKWGGAPAIPIDDDGGYRQLETAIKALLSELNSRLVSLKSGQRQFVPLTIIADELQTLVEECESASLLFKQVGRLGGELKIRLVAIATSDQVKSLGIEGEGDTRDNFTIVRLAEHAYRKAPTIKELQLGRPAVVEYHGETYAVDLSATRTLATRQILSLRYYPFPPQVGSDAALLASGLSEEIPKAQPQRVRFNSHNLWENDARDAENSPTPESDFPAAEKEIPVSEPTFQDEDIAKIAAAIALGKGKTEILKSMVGYSGRNHRTYSIIYERIKKAVEEVTQEEVTEQT